MTFSLSIIKIYAYERTQHNDAGDERYRYFLKAKLLGAHKKISHFKVIKCLIKTDPFL